LTARVARASNPQGTTAMWVRDQLDGLWCDEDFAAWYPRDGRPGLSPAQLATVCVLQFLLNLSDRQAAEAVRCRLDFKYALGLELDDPGFHHSVLGDFRDRLAQDDRADQLLDLALARLTAAGLVKQRGRQRTNSTHVLAAARELTRLELVLEAVRAALEELACDAVTGRLHRPCRRVHAHRGPGLPRRPHRAPGADPGLVPRAAPRGRRPCTVGNPPRRLPRGPRPAPARRRPPGAHRPPPGRHHRLHRLPPRPPAAPPPVSSGRAVHGPGVVGQGVTTTAIAEALCRDAAALLEAYQAGT